MEVAFGPLLPFLICPFLIHLAISVEIVCAVLMVGGRVELFNRTEGSICVAVPDGGSVL